VRPVPTTTSSAVGGTGLLVAKTGRGVAHGSTWVAEEGRPNPGGRAGRRKVDGAPKTKQARGLRGGTPHTKDPQSPRRGRSAVRAVGQRRVLSRPRAAPIASRRGPAFVRPSPDPSVAIVRDVPGLWKTLFSTSRFRHGLSPASGRTTSRRPSQDRVGVLDHGGQPPTRGRPALDCRPGRTSARLRGKVLAWVHLLDVDVEGWPAAGQPAADG